MSHEFRCTVPAMLVATAICLIAGCTGDPEEAKPSPTASATTASAILEDTTPGEGGDAPPPLEEAPPSDALFGPDWQTGLDIVDGPTKFTAAEGITLEVYDAQVSNVPEAPEEAVELMSEIFQTDIPIAIVLGIQVRASNNTGQDIEWFADQATLSVAGFSLEPESPFSDPLGTQGRLLSGVSHGGPVYVLPDSVSIDDIMTADARLVGPAPIDPDTNEQLGHELDLSFSWQPRSE